MTIVEQPAPEVRRTGPVMDVRDLRVWYGTTRGAIRAVDGVTFELQAGETLGLVGESGCGKSTLGRGLMGLLPEGAKRDGAVLFKGDDILQMSVNDARAMRGADLGMIFQEPLTRLNPLMRISQHFEETVKQHEPGLTKAAIRERSLEVLRLMGIPPTRYRSYPHEFSGGMRQRLMIALALVLRPAFVVADEPTTALDVLVEAQIIEILNELRKNFDTALLLITHNLGIIAEACDRVAVMYAGRLVEQGPVEDIFRRPRHPYTANLIASTPRLDRASTGRLTAIPGTVPAADSEIAGCAFAPRCSRAGAKCETERPYVDPEQEHGFACWYPLPEGDAAEPGLAVEARRRR
jgi:peptide/nickel transport system ATP-binding protein